MKTKILLTIILIAFLLPDKIFAQGVYYNISAGYGLRISSQNISNFHFTNYTVDTVTTTFEQVNVSLGKGFSFEGGFGYMFNKNIGAELGISYLLGSKTTSKQALYDGTRNTSFSANMFRINPSIVIASGFENFNPYAKFGLIVGFGKIMYEDEYTFYDKRVLTEKMELNGGIAFGLNASVGAIYNISNLISLFGEINMVNLSYSPTKGKLTESRFNDGTDRLTSLLNDEKEVEYFDSYTTIVNDPNSHSNPRKELKQSFPFGSVGMNIGLRITL